MQDCPLTYALSCSPLYSNNLILILKSTLNNSDLIFSVPKLISFLSQGTTLPAGTIILTGTPPGVGAAKNPKGFLKAGDDFAVELLPHVGTLVTKMENQV